MPINNWMNEQNVVYSYDGVLFSLKKDYWYVQQQMNRKDFLLSETSHIFSCPFKSVPFA